MLFYEMCKVLSACLLAERRRYRRVINRPVKHTIYAVNRRFSVDRNIKKYKNISHCLDSRSVNYLVFFLSDAGKPRRKPPECVHRP